MPNYGLEPTDIRRFGVNQDPVHTDHITLQQLKKPQSENQTILATINTETVSPATAFSLGAHVDALFQGTGSQLPPAIILDYIYGIAAYKCWRSGQVHSVEMESHCKPPVNHDVDPSEFSEEENDTQYSEYIPSPSPEEQVKTCHHGHTHGCGYTPLLLPQRQVGDTMGEVMDELNAVLMSLEGYTPQEASKRREKRREEEELKVQAASRSKVTEWMNTTTVSGL